MTDDALTLNPPHLLGVHHHPPQYRVEEAAVVPPETPSPSSSRGRTKRRKRNENDKEKKRPRLERKKKESNCDENKEKRKSILDIPANLFFNPVITNPFIWENKLKKQGLNRKQIKKLQKDKMSSERRKLREKEEASKEIQMAEAVSTPLPLYSIATFLEANACFCPY